MRFLAFIFALYGTFYLGTTKVPQHRLEGTQWCFLGEFKSLEEFGMTVTLPYALVDVQKDKVKVYTRCK